MGDSDFFHLNSSYFKDFCGLFLSPLLRLCFSGKKNPKHPLPALQMLDAPEALEATVYHDGHACAQRFTLLHAIERKRGDS